MADERTRERRHETTVLGAGCAGCLLLAIIACVTAGLWVRRSVSWLTTPPKRTGPYHWGYWARAPRVAIALPDGSTLRYGHYLIGTSAAPQAGEGSRGVRRIAKAGGSQEWPLPYSHERAVRVGVYWHPAAGGQGPFVRFFDATGTSALDLGRREVGAIERIGARSAMDDYAYNDHTFWSGTGGPGLDVTRAVAPANSRYLGSIVRVGNGLVFRPTASRGPSKPARR